VQLFAGRFVPVDDNWDCAFFSTGASDSRSNAFCPARDEDYFVPELQIHGCNLANVMT
jgi:hypothetical protein